MFKITGHNGFHITFENGYTVSIQFGPGTYSDNYNQPFPNRERKGTALRLSSSTAECAIWIDGSKSGRDMIAHKSFNGDKVSNRSTPAEALNLLNWAARQKPDNHKPK